MPFNPGDQAVFSGQGSQFVGQQGQIRKTPSWDANGNPVTLVEVQNPATGQWEQAVDNGQGGYMSTSRMRNGGQFDTGAPNQAASSNYNFGADGTLQNASRENYDKGNMLKDTLHILPMALGGIAGLAALGGMPLWGGALAGGGGSGTMSGLDAGVMTEPEAAAQAASFHSQFAPYLANPAGAVGFDGGGGGVGSGGLGDGGDGNPFAGAVADGSLSFDPSAALAGTGLAGLAGPAAALAGGVLGSQGVKQTQTADHKLDPRLDAPVFGDGGLIPRTQSLLASQMPQAQQAGDFLQNYGRGLLNQPIAPNGFSLLTRGKYGK